MAQLTESQRREARGEARGEQYAAMRVLEVAISMMRSAGLSEGQMRQACEKGITGGDPAYGVVSSLRANGAEA